MICIKENVGFSQESYHSLRPPPMDLLLYYTQQNVKNLKYGSYSVSDVEDYVRYIKKINKNLTMTY